MKTQPALVYQLKLSQEFSGKLQTLEGSYAYRWKDIWPEIFASLTTATLDSLSEGTDPSPEAVALSNIGLGVSHQSHTVQKLLKMPNAFESITVGLGYYILQGAEHGPGFKTDFKTFIHTSSNLHYGLKCSYHLIHLFNASPVKFFSWLTVGLDIAYYF